MKTDEVFKRIVYNSKTRRHSFIGHSYHFQGKIIHYRMKKLNTGCAIINKSEIKV